LPQEYGDALDNVIKDLLKSVFDGKPDSVPIAGLTTKTLAKQVANNYSIRPDYETPDAQMLMRLTRDVWQFAAAKTYQEMRDLTLALKDNNGKLREWNSFVEQAQKITGKYNATWMRTEYNAAVGSSIMASRWVQFEAEQKELPFLRYETVGDSSVRPEHEMLDGVTRPVSDEWWDTHYPPNGWGCRCDVVQVPMAEAKVTPKKQLPDQPINTMFQTNLAKTGLVYPQGHPYYNGVPAGELRKAMAYLPPENTYVNVSLENGAIDIHPLHAPNNEVGNKTLKQSIDDCITLLKHEPEAKLKLLPIIEQKDFAIKNRYYPQEYIDKFKLKNADCLFNGRVVEFEEPTGSENSIKKAIRSGKDQADFVILRIPDNVEWDSIRDSVYGQLKHYEGQNIEVWIMNNNEMRKYKTR
jgi:SPP1 gp7 family putative phage head morphogenesis protein